MGHSVPVRTQEITSVPNSKSPLKLDGFIPVAVETLRSSTDLDFDIYLPPDGPGAAKLYRERNVPCEAADLDKLLDAGVQTLYIPVAMARAYREHLKQHVLGDESIPVGNRLQLLKEAARVTFYQALRSGDASNARLAPKWPRAISSSLNSPPRTSATLYLPVVV